MLRAAGNDVPILVLTARDAVVIEWTASTHSATTTWPSPSP
jgi:hypothetical protein